MTAEPLALWAQAQTLVQQQQIATAIPVLETLRQAWNHPAAMPATERALHTWPEALQELVLLPPEQSLSWCLDHFYQHRLLLAWCYRTQERWPEALQALEELHSFYPYSPEILRLLGRFAFWAGYPEMAEHHWQQLLMIDPAEQSVYADLAYLANQNGDWNKAVHYIHQGLALGATPELLQELLLACAHGSGGEFRRSLLEVMVRFITEQTFPILCEMAQRLYQEGDFEHTEYLTYHLNAVHPGEQNVLNLYVLSALQLKHFAPAIECLLRQLEAEPYHAGLWFKLGMAYRKWNLRLFARHAFYRAIYLGEKTEIASLATEQFHTIPTEVSLDHCLAEIAKVVLVNAAFRRKLRHHPQSALAEYGIEWSDELALILNASIWTDSAHLTG